MAEFDSVDRILYNLRIDIDHYKKLPLKYRIYMHNDAIPFAFTGVPKLRQNNIKEWEQRVVGRTFQWHIGFGDRTIIKIEEIPGSTRERLIFTRVF